MTNESTLEITAKSPVWHRLLLHQWQKSFGGWLVISTTALTILFIGYQIFGFGEEKQIALQADALQAIISIAVVILSWRVMRHPAIDEESRRAWRLVAASFAAYCFGHTLWFYYSSILGVEPFPSVADIGFWAFYPLMMWALLSFPTAKTSKSERIKFITDVGIVLLGGTTAVWHFIIRPTIENSAEGEWLMTALNLSYVVGDLILLLGIATVLLRYPSKINKVALFTIVFGLLNTAVADIGFAAFTLQGTYKSGHWIDNFFITGLLIFLIACHFQYQNLSQTEESEESEQEYIAQKFSWLPYSAIAVGFGILVVETRPFWGEWLGIIVFSSIAMTGLVVLRQIAAVKENVRFHANQAERRSEGRFRSLVQNSSDLITILDFDGKIIYESPAITNVLGYELSELIGQDSFEIIHPEDVEKRKEIIKKLIDEPHSIINTEMRFKHKNGNWHFLETAVRLVDDEENGLKGILVNSRDVSQRKQDEEKLRLYTLKLEQSNRELQDFAYVASHDLQEPLRKVQAFGDRLDRKCGEILTDEGRDYIKRMRDASARMQTLINDLLTFSRVTTKAQPFKSLNFAEVVQGVVSDLEVRIEQTNAIVEIGELPKLEADESQMRQLMQNLIGNALKFSKRDEMPHIKIYCEQFTNSVGAFSINGEFHTTEAADNFCKIIVEDNGIGFEEKYLDRIFTVFQRLHGRGEYEGSGVGLAVCRKIVERHNGEITAESEPQKGAKFIVTLPLKQVKGELSE